MTITKKRLCLFLLVLSLAVLPFAGCSNSASSQPAGSAAASAASADNSGGAAAPTTLRVAWWGNQVRNDRTVEVLNLYSEQNPNIRFETEFTDWTGYWDKLATQAASNSMPDVIQQDYSYIKQYQTKKQLANLDEFVSSGVLDTSNCADILDSGRIGGNLYAVPLGMNAPGLVYDQDAVASAGVEMKNGMTRPELEAAAEKIYAATGKKFDWAYYDGTSFLSHMTRGAGFEVLQDGKLGVNSSADLLPYFQLHADSVKKDYYMAPEELTEAVGAGIEMDPLSTGKAWMALVWSNQLVAHSDAAGKDLGMVTWPVGENDTQKAMFYKPSMFFSVAESSGKKEAAAMVVNFFTNTEEANGILLGERGVPISIVVAETIKPQMPPANQYVFDYLAEISDLCGPIGPPTPAGAGEVTSLCDSLTEQVVYGSMTPEAAAEKFFNDGNAILAKAAAEAQ